MWTIKQAIVVTAGQPILQAVLSIVHSVRRALPSMNRREREAREQSLREWEEGLYERELLTCSLYLHCLIICSPVYISYKENERELSQS